MSEYKPETNAHRQPGLVEIAHVALSATVSLARIVYQIGSGLVVDSVTDTTRKITRGQ